MKVEFYKRNNNLFSEYVSESDLRVQQNKTVCVTRGFEHWFFPESTLHYHAIPRRLGSLEQGRQRSKHY